MEARYELFDHTADMGIRVRAASLAELLAPAGEALYAVIGEVVAGSDADPVTFDLAGTEPPLLYRDYLAELLVLFERDARRVTTLAASVFEEQHLRVTARTANVDQTRSLLLREVKAITYHMLGLRSIPGGYEATVIVDI
jgi:SHS2 domain-containing protein